MRSACTSLRMIFFLNRVGALEISAKIDIMREQYDIN